MQNLKLKFKTFILLFVLSISIFFVLDITINAYYTEVVKISSQGHIVIPIVQFPEAYMSEIREVAVSRGTMHEITSCDWDVITEILASYNITGIAAPMLLNYGAYYPSRYVQSFSDRDELALAIQAAHSRGLSVRVSFAVLYKSPNDAWKVKRSDGTLENWLDPTNPEAREHVLNLVRELVSNYDFETLSLDYIRYDDGDMPYTETAKRQLEDYLNETITNWPGDFAPYGSRWNEFLEWRTIPINNLVSDIYNLVKSIKPQIVVAANTILWPYHPRWTIQTYGQDWTAWVKGGYLDRVIPMTYVEDLNVIQNVINSYWDYGVAGPEGAITLTPYLSIKPEGTPLTPEKFKAQVDLIRSLGCDGFAISAYGGPGDNPNNPDPMPDIRPYLSILTLPKIYELNDIKVQILNATTITITWRTSQPTTSKLEYATSRLFDATYEYIGPSDPYPGVHYWNMEHYPGIMIEDITSVTNHIITLTNLEKEQLYFFRVQCQGLNVTVTSLVYNFKINL
jgi:hypothetical protein